MTSEKGDPSTVAGEFPSDIGGGGGSTVPKVGTARREPFKILSPSSPPRTSPPEIRDRGGYNINNNSLSFEGDAFAYPFVTIYDSILTSQFYGVYKLKDTYVLQTVKRTFDTSITLTPGDSTFTSYTAIQDNDAHLGGVDLIANFQPTGTGTLPAGSLSIDFGTFLGEGTMFPDAVKPGTKVYNYNSITSAESFYPMIREFGFPAYPAVDPTPKGGVGYYGIRPSELNTGARLTFGATLGSGAGTTISGSVSVRMVKVFGFYTYPIDYTVTSFK